MKCTESIDGFGCDCHPYINQGWSIVSDDGNASMFIWSPEYAGVDNYGIIDFVVKEAVRGKGIGTQLLEEVIQKFDDLPLTLEVTENNQAIHLYKRLGFQQLEIHNSVITMMRNKYKED